MKQNLRIQNTNKRKERKKIQISKKQKNLKEKTKKNTASYFTAYQTRRNKEKGFMLKIKTRKSATGPHSTNPL